MQPVRATPLPPLPTTTPITNDFFHLCSERSENDSGGEWGWWQMKRKCVSKCGEWGDKNKNSQESVAGRFLGGCWKFKLRYENSIFQKGRSVRHTSSQSWLRHQTCCHKQQAFIFGSVFKTGIDKYLTTQPGPRSAASDRTHRQEVLVRWREPPKPCILDQCTRGE